MIDIEILNKLNAPTREERIANLREVLKTTEFPPMVPQYINNHIHTTYSFSPYSPTAAVYAARMEGLCTAGIIDHDSISGAEEFIEKILVDKFHAKYIVVGRDFCFGHGKRGDYHMLQEYGEKYGFQVDVVEKKRYEGREISSTYIKELLNEGKKELADKLLGYEYKNL